MEGSEINNISHIKILGNKFLSAEQYLEYSQLSDIVNEDDISPSIIRDRLSKHPYIKNIDVVKEERGIVKILIFERKFDAVILQNSEKFLICESAEIVPLVKSTSNINLPVIINNLKNYKADVFSNACSNDRLFQALKIITTAEIYDQVLFNNISEINIYNENISIQLIDFPSLIYFGIDHEIEKTVYLSKIFKRIKRNKYSDYLDYIDLRFEELVYLGFDEKFINDKENI
ncbi:MAG: FtsQ-type POTRA domain-containing protein [Melioribacteraceae bacterium]|nr:FtsQ-type POTRA domain-containing protein [Melioribacteraceae bacterium]